MTTALAGNNNDIMWIASDPAVTITYVQPEEQAATTVTVVGKNITVTPGTKARMTVSGTLSSNGSNPSWIETTLIYDQNGNMPVYGGGQLNYDGSAYRWKFNY